MRRRVDVWAIATGRTAVLTIRHAIRAQEVPWSISRPAVLASLSRLRSSSATVRRSSEPHRPRLRVDGRKCPHCCRRIRFIRFDRCMTSPPHHTARLGDYAVAASSSPYLRTRRWSCVRDNPSRRAALVLFPRLSCRTLAIVVRSSALRSVVSWRDDLAAGCRARCSASMSAPSQRIAARSRTLRSSLTFPGH